MAGPVRLDTEGSFLTLWLGDEAAAAQPHDVAKRGKTCFEINSVPLSPSSVWINTFGLWEQSAKCIVSSFFQQLARIDDVV